MLAGARPLLGTSASPPSLSIVIPAYNEQYRLPSTLDDSLCYLRQLRRKWEVIIVDDGSTDDTAHVVTKAQMVEPRVRLLRSPLNYGKGAAVAAGARHSHGERILVMDADGSTSITFLHNLEGVMDRDRCDIVVGQRLDKRPWPRRLMGVVFKRVAATCVTQVADTQCGFKLLSADAAELTLTKLHITRWAFDVELLFLAEQFDLGVSSAQVSFSDVPGSKINWWTPAEMLFDVLQVGTFYRLGLWHPRGNRGGDELLLRPQRPWQTAYTEAIR